MRNMIEEISNADDMLIVVAATENLGWCIQSMSITHVDGDGGPGTAIGMGDVSTNVELSEIVTAFGVIFAVACPKRLTLVMLEPGGVASVLVTADGGVSGEIGDTTWDKIEERIDSLIGLCRRSEPHPDNPPGAEDVQNVVSVTRNDGGGCVIPEDLLALFAAADAAHQQQADGTDEQHVGGISGEAQRSDQHDRYGQG